MQRCPLDRKGPKLFARKNIAKRKSRRNPKLDANYLLFAIYDMVNLFKRQTYGFGNAVPLTLYVLQKCQYCLKLNLAITLVKGIRVSNLLVCSIL